jgi:hypothetical protein
MKIRAVLPVYGRDLRLDLFRGIANWAIFLNHIPNNAVNWITTRNYGFSDGADLFVFISGYTVAIVYGRMMADHGFLIAATRLAKRIWQLYVAHVMLLVIYAAAVGYVALRFGYDNILHEFNVVNLILNPIATMIEGLILRFKPYNLDVPPLYIVLMGLFPFVLWSMLRRPGLTMLGSFALYFAARQLGWNLSGPKASGVMISAKTRHAPPTFNPNDKTNLAPYRALHFVVLAVLVARFLPKDWKGLNWAAFDPLIKCGQQSLRVFCVGVFLSFLGYFLLTISSGTILKQVLVSAAGIATLCAVAYYGDWSKQADKTVKRPSPLSTAIASDGRGE